MNTIEKKDFGENLLHKIKEEKIQPKPKWQFLLKDTVIWSLGLLALCLGSIAMSLVFYMLKNEDASVYNRAGSGILEAFLIIIPFFWLICLLFFAASVYYYIKHTKNGYKYSAAKVILIIITSSLILGGALNASGFDQVVDDTLGQHAPLYDQVINPRVAYWSNSEEGRLSGLVTSEVTPMEYNLIDHSGETWSALLVEEENQEKMIVGSPVRLVGKKITDHKFMVKETLPLGPGRGVFKRPAKAGKVCGPDQIKCKPKKNLR